MAEKVTINIIQIFLDVHALFTLYCYLFNYDPAYAHFIVICCLWYSFMFPIFLFVFQNLAGSAVRRKGINEFGQHFRASLYSYDEVRDFITRSAAILHAYWSIED